jgi:hypothetical protein
VLLQLEGFKLSLGSEAYNQSKILSTEIRSRGYEPSKMRVGIETLIFTLESYCIDILDSKTETTNDEFSELSSQTDSSPITTKIDAISEGKEMHR